MRRAAAALGDDARHARKNVTEGGAGDACDEDIARSNSAELAFTIDDDRASGGPADAGRMTIETRML